MTNSLGDNIISECSSTYYGGSEAKEKYGATCTDISSHPSYHGDITGSEAKEKLMEHGATCYLTRYSRVREDYILSVLTNTRSEDELTIHNFTISIEGHRYEIDGTEYPFDSIHDLLKFYEHTPVSHKVSHIGAPCIKESSLSE